MGNQVQTGGYKEIDATGVVSPIRGDLIGIFVSVASDTPTITIGDSATGTPPYDFIISSFTPVAGTFYPIPASYNTGLYIAIGGTVTATVIFA